MPRLQDLIHSLELGAGVRYLRIVALFLAMVTVAVVYDLREAQNFRAEEAMDAAQLGRNLAAGRGFTTHFVRPLSIGVLREHREDRSAMLDGNHPDLANAPLYPLFLSALMRIPGLFDHHIASPKEAEFWRHQPDFLITLFNQGLYFLAILLTWRLAQRLFDNRVALLTVVMMLGSELLWQFSASGLSTMLALVLVTALANFLSAIEAGARREPPLGAAGILGLAALSGLCCGLLALTRYSLGVLILPVLVYLVSGSHGRRVGPAVLAALMFLGTFSPWLVRNWQVCGNPLGVAGYSLVQETPDFPENWLERTLEPNLANVTRDDIVRKAFIGTLSVVRDELPQLGGTWVSAFFLVGLLIPFVEGTRTRMRWFTVGALAILTLAQVLSRTHLSADVPRVNSENLLVLMIPLVFMFGASLVALLVYSLDLMAEAWRPLILGGVVAVLWLPLLITFGPPRNPPLAYPPYFPPSIQRVSQWFEPNELVMTDMPWAVAWYGNRQGILLSSTPDKEFLDIHDWLKPVSGLYLTRITLDQRFITGWVLNGRKWGRFMTEFMTQSVVPQGFPLRKAPDFTTTFPDHLLLADKDRWSDAAPAIAIPKSLESSRPEKKSPASTNKVELGKDEKAKVGR